MFVQVFLAGCRCLFCEKSFDVYIVYYVLAKFGDIVSWYDKLGGGKGVGGCEISRHGDGEIYIEKLINPLSGVTEVMLGRAA